MNAFIRVCRNNHFKVPLTEEMMHYYLSLGFRCWVAGINGLYLINNKNGSKYYHRCLTISDIKYILNHSLEYISFDGINNYITSKYGKIQRTLPEC